ncbi:MAG: ribosome maturation factor RimM [Rhizobiaceae bacterium]
MSKTRSSDQDKSHACKVVLGVGGAPHGIKGELRIKTFTDDPLAIGNYGPLTGSDGKSYEVTSVRPAKNVVVARLRGVTSREAAEALNGVEFSVSREVLGDDELDDDEFFHADLIGLTAIDEDANRYGKVMAVHNFGGGDMLELTDGGRTSVLIPFSEAAVPIIDIEGGTITVEPVAAGLVDDPEEGRQ